ncbi:MAG: hypothetical protein ILA06_10190 [Bacteroidaceae bacterium]|nr:hypothetical protein [Bacteroidaceae bacterium]
MMKTDYILRGTMALAMLFASSTLCIADPVLLEPVPGNFDLGNDGPKRSPLQSILPSIDYNVESSYLTFATSITLFITYEIVDADDNIVASEILSLSSSQPEIVSVSNLPEGNHKKRF